MTTSNTFKVVGKVVGVEFVSDYDWKLFVKSKRCENPFEVTYKGLTTLDRTNMQTAEVVSITGEISVSENGSIVLNGWKYLTVRSD